MLIKQESKCIFFLVNNQKDVENQLGIRITDSGIGNPRQVSKDETNIHT